MIIPKPLPTPSWASARSIIPARSVILASARISPIWLRLSDSVKAIGGHAVSSVNVGAEFSSTLCPSFRCMTGRLGVYGGHSEIRDIPPRGGILFDSAAMPSWWNAVKAMPAFPMPSWPHAVAITALSLEPGLAPPRYLLKPEEE